MAKESQVKDKNWRHSHEETGIVISDKMKKTITVESFRLVKHPKYGKYVKKSSIYKAHDEKEEAKVGDKVRIVETRPLSKTKFYMLKTILEKAQRG